MLQTWLFDSTAVEEMVSALSIVPWMDPVPLTISPATSQAVSAASSASKPRTSPLEVSNPNEAACIWVASVWAARASKKSSSKLVCVLSRSLSKK